MKTNLIKIPNVGEATKQSLINVGITCVEDLVGKNPQELYEMDCKVKGVKVDRCQLYLFRMAAFYAENRNIDESKLKWWDFKD